MTTRYTTTCDDCGFTGTYKTLPLAEHHHRRHSCERTRKLAAQAARVKARQEDPGTRRECHHPQVKHQHGTAQAYMLDKCRCRPCRNANLQREQQRRRAKLYGRYDSGRVDAQPAREHLTHLINAGVSLKRCAELAGVGHSTLGYILYGRTERNEPPRKRIEKHVHDAILAIRPTLENMAPGRRIPSAGTARRLQALATLGYSLSALAAMIGVERTNMESLLNPAREVTVKKARTVRDLYEKLWDTPNTPTEWRAKISASRARNMAKAKGWAPPMAWDDDTIDDPAAQPQGIPTKSRYGHAEADIIEDVTDLLTAGVGSATICQRLGRQQASIERTLDRAGRHDLAAWLRNGTRPNINPATRKSAPASRADAA